METARCCPQNSRRGGLYSTALSSTSSPVTLHMVGDRDGCHYSIFMIVVGPQSISRDPSNGRSPEDLIQGFLRYARMIVRSTAVPKPSFI